MYASMLLWLRLLLSLLGGGNCRILWLCRSLSVCMWTLGHILVCVWMCFSDFYMLAQTGRVCAALLCSISLVVVSRPFSLRSFCILLLLLLTCSSQHDATTAADWLTNVKMSWIRVSSSPWFSTMKSIVGETKGTEFVWRESSRIWLWSTTGVLSCVFTTFQGRSRFWQLWNPCV